MNPLIGKPSVVNTTRSMLNRVWMDKGWMMGFAVSSKYYNLNSLDKLPQILFMPFYMLEVEPGVESPIPL